VNARVEDSIFYCRFYSDLSMFSCTRNQGFNLIRCPIEVSGFRGHAEQLLSRPGKVAMWWDDFDFNLEDTGNLMLKVELAAKADAVAAHSWQ